MAAPLPAPTQANLREAAVSHLARFATTRARLTRVLDRRVERWLRQQPEVDPAQAAAARAAVREVVASLAASGVVDDAAFAEARAHRMARSGRSRLAIAAHLAARGVATNVAQAAMPDDPDSELAAALAVAQRRRIGPFREGETDAEGRRHELAALARAGFPRDVSIRALNMKEAEAENLILRLRRS